MVVRIGLIFFVALNAPNKPLHGTSPIPLSKIHLVAFSVCQESVALLFGLTVAGLTLKLVIFSVLTGLTVIVIDEVTGVDPDCPEAVRVYLVVEVGLTLVGDNNEDIKLGEHGTLPTPWSIVQALALVVAQFKLVLSPAVRVVWSALKLSIEGLLVVGGGGGGGAVTEIIICLLVAVVPLPPLAVKVKVVSLVGLTVRLELLQATEPILLSKLQLVALLVDQVRIALLPDWIELELLVNELMLGLITGGGRLFTVIVTLALRVWEPGCPITVKV